MLTRRSFSAHLEAVVNQAPAYATAARLSATANAPTARPITKTAGNVGMRYVYWRAHPVMSNAHSTLIQCPSGSSCKSGTCVCDSGKTLCNGKCTDCSSDNKNCGKCGNEVCLLASTSSDVECSLDAHSVPIWKQL